MFYWEAPVYLYNKSGKQKIPFENGKNIEMILLEILEVNKIFL
jgi:hypothetical protein